MNRQFEVIEIQKQSK